MPQVLYSVTVADPSAHLFRIECNVEASNETLVFRLPSWIRGSYAIRDFAKHIVRIDAWLDDQPVVVHRIDKRSFRCVAGGRLRLEYEVYAFDPSVRKAFLDLRRGFFNGSSLFYCPVGFENARFEIDIRRPDMTLCPNWRLATAMSPIDVDSSGYGRYQAQSYEELIDHPVEMADFRSVDFVADGVPHRLTLSGRCDPDLDRLAVDIARICAAQRELFGHEPALDRYLFLTQVTANGYGGLEHRASTALVCARDALPKPGQPALRKGYRGFLGLVSHEYFHLWNVKRITPERFAASDLAAEAYSEDLWAYEGVTSYYDDLMLLRAGILDAPAYLDLLAETATRLERSSGSKVQTLADASFEAWIKYYQPDENTPNQAVSYYVKGALVALCLDLTLRLRCAFTLDDVMRTLWQRYGRLDRPVPEGGIEAIASELCGASLQAFFDASLRSTTALPLADLLAGFGVAAQLRNGLGTGDEGGRREGTPLTVSLGLQVRASDGGITQIQPGSPASHAGLCTGDQLVALDGLRVSGAAWATRMESLTVGTPVQLHVFRGDELIETTLLPAAAIADTWTLSLMDSVTEDVAARRKAWLGQ